LEKINHALRVVPIVVVIVVHSEGSSARRARLGMPAMKIKPEAARRRRREEKGECDHESGE
jgi:hypothetical protein